MFLNETKPPLDEALEHFGVRGMKWGIRKASSTSSYDDDLEFEKPDHTGRKVAVAGLVIAGAAVTLMILQANGKLPVPKTPSMPSSPFMNRSFRPKNVGNPLFTVHPKAPKVTKDFVDAGFGKNGVFNVTTMKRGAKTVKDFDSNIWDVPVKALTSGR